MSSEQVKQELEEQRRKLFDAFQIAKEKSDPAKMKQLEDAAGEIDDALDELALRKLKAVEAKLAGFRAKVEKLTKIAQAGPFGGMGEEGDGVPDTGDADETEEEPVVDAGPPPPPPVPTDPVNVKAKDPGPNDTGPLRLTEAHLIALWKRSAFPIDGRGLIVFGIRGCRPVDYSGTPFGDGHQIELTPVNYRTMNCTIGQWRPGAGLAVFPGSTVPYVDFVSAAVSAGGAGVNQLGRGRYVNYRPGWHKRKEGKNGHWALLQECPITIQRTGDDLDYDLDDRWFTGTIAGDDIHCAFHMGEDGHIPDARYSSAGCQVIAGTVKKGVAGSERGPWAKFIAPFLPAAGPQDGVEYVLFEGAEVGQMIRNQCKGKTVILRVGSKGEIVKLLQQRLSAKLGRHIDDDGDFGPGTFQAVIDFQSQAFGDNSDDGVVGPDTAAELGIVLPGFDFADAVSGGSGAVEPPANVEALSGRSGVAVSIDKLAVVTVERVSGMFPHTDKANIKANLPFVLSSLTKRDLADKPMVLMALSTIRAESASFRPIDEGVSKFNTRVTLFDLYDAGTSKGAELGNTQPGDGPRFKGRGFVQLTGRDNYTKIGKALQLPLTDNPSLANDQQIAAEILGEFLKNKETKIRKALNKSDLDTARVLVNGGKHGLANFKDAFEKGETLLPEF